MIANMTRYSKMTEKLGGKLEIAFGWARGWGKVRIF